MDEGTHITMPRWVLQRMLLLHGKECEGCASNRPTLCNNPAQRKLIQAWLDSIAVGAHHGPRVVHAGGSIGSEDVACPTCSAPVGEPCRTVTTCNCNGDDDWTHVASCPMFEYGARTPV